jgi:hypothetical protein
MTLSCHIFVTVGRRVQEDAGRVPHKTQDPAAVGLSRGATFQQVRAAALHSQCDETDE